MKKNVTRLISVLAICAMIGTFASCQTVDVSELREMGEQERALALLDMANETMDSLDSYTFEADVDMGYANKDTTASGSVENVTQIVNQGSSKLMHLSRTETAVTVNEMNVEEPSVDHEGYFKEKMYLGKKQGNYEQKLCSSMEIGDYEAYYKDNLLGALPAKESVSVVSCTEGSDGTWSMKLTSKQQSKLIESTMVLLFDSIEEELSFTDAKIDVLLDSRFRVLSILWEFSYSCEAEFIQTPKLVCKVEFDKFNKIGRAHV